MMSVMTVTLRIISGIERVAKYLLVLQSVLGNAFCPQRPDEVRFGFIAIPLILSVLISHPYALSKLS